MCLDYKLLLHWICTLYKNENFDRNSFCKFHNQPHIVCTERLTLVKRIVWKGTSTFYIFFYELPRKNCFHSTCNLYNIILAGLGTIILIVFHCFNFMNKYRDFPKYFRLYTTCITSMIEFFQIWKSLTWWKMLFACLIIYATQVPKFVKYATVFPTHPALKHFWQPENHQRLFALIWFCIILFYGFNLNVSFTMTLFLPISPRFLLEKIPK